MNRFLLLLILVVIVSCESADRQPSKVYFDFDSLVNQQVAALSEKHISLIKYSSMDDLSDTVTFIADSVSLSNELDVFRKLDLINRPAYKDVYEVMDGIKDSKSNLLIKKLVAKNNSPVSTISFYYQTSFKNIKKVEAEFEEKNILYFTKRNIQLELNDISGEDLISRFKISGIQKRILSDTLNFYLDVEVAGTN
jgi:hypothetical protein